VHWLKLKVLRLPERRHRAHALCLASDERIFNAYVRCSLCSCAQSTSDYSVLYCTVLYCIAMSSNSFNASIYTGSSNLLCTTRKIRNYFRAHTSIQSLLYCSQSPFHISPFHPEPLARARFYTPLCTAHDRQHSLSGDESSSTRLQRRTRGEKGASSPCTSAGSRK